jgi:hypothetical protein
MTNHGVRGRADAVLRTGTMVMLGLLVVQFCVGMYLNLFVELPATHPGVGGSYAPSIPWALSGAAGVALAIHVTIWILLTAGAIALVVRGAQSRRKALIVGNSLGLALVLSAGSGGLTFVNRGGDDHQSLLMAVSFILALGAYAITLYVDQMSGAWKEDAS